MSSVSTVVCAPTSIVPIPSSNEEIRLVDDAFGKISHMVSDGSWMVRVQAAKTLVRPVKIHLRVRPAQLWKEDLLSFCDSGLDAAG